MEKKSNKLFGFLLLFLIALLSLGMVFSKPAVINEKNEPDLASLDTNDYFLDDLFLNNIIQYQHLKSLEADRNIPYSDLFLDNPDPEIAEAFNEYLIAYSGLDDVTDFDNFYEYLQRRNVLDFYAESKNTRSYTLDLSDLKNGSNDKAKYFKWYIIMNYDANGKLSVSHASNELIKTISSKYFKGSLMESGTFNFEPIVQNGVVENSGKINVKPIKDATFIYAISNERYEMLVDGTIYSSYLPGYYSNGESIGMIIFLTITVGAIIAAFFIASRHVRELSAYDTLLKCPFEILVIVLTLLISLAFTWNYLMLIEVGNSDFVTEMLSGISKGKADIIINSILLVSGFAYLFLVTVAVYEIKQIFILGIGDFFMKYTILGWCIRKISAFFDVFKDIDLTDKMNKKIVTALILNLIVGCIACIFWALGPLLLIIYTIFTYQYIKRVIGSIQTQFQVLETVTEELSMGNLDVEVEDELVVFGDVKENLLGIKSGFKRAVEEEVRSSKMKTELISNVSHDLKTPLTTLISYIDLLQKENITEEERAHYIQVLDNSSMRLKRCIDDLFEISKVESGNVQCSLMEVNLSDLLKQIQFELSDKIEASNLTFKTSYPEQKVMCMLDSPKTYRIFDNLYMNIFKYAMPYTRVYIELKEENGFAVVSFKNVSSTEITYAADELTERFVRNDASRNSEGSGLGLAIAKSFTELQGGSFKVLVDGDLFKVLIKFELLKKAEVTEDENEEQA